MAASVGYLVIDSINPSALAPFWCAMLDTAVDNTSGPRHMPRPSVAAKPIMWPSDKEDS
jgi:hypothetical protein